ncbi:MAG: hypothetical protein V3T55_00670 [Anaerolineales bacterium]
MTPGIPYQTGQSSYKLLVRPQGGNPHVTRHTKLLGKLAVFKIELDKGFGVFGNEGNGKNNERNAILGATNDLALSGWAYPFKGTDSTLIADKPFKTLCSETTGAQLPNYELRHALDLPYIRIASLDNALRQAMSGE